jgi:DNA-binding response OmpR family regulator
MEGIMKKILLAIEDYGIAMLYEEELRDDGYEIVVSDDPERLIETIAWENPDLVLLDIEIRGFNGLDLLWDIRNKYYDLPVILCSSYPENRYDSRAIAADYFVIHRSDLSELKIKIKVIIEGNAHLRYNVKRPYEKAKNALGLKVPENQSLFKEFGA